MSSIAPCRSDSTPASWRTASNSSWSSPRSRATTRPSSKRATCSSCRRSITKAGPPFRTRGGAPGFVKVIDPKTVVFPSFDGNGMFFSMGNIAGNAQIGMLFIDFENPLRLRLQGVASVHTDDPLLAEYKEAELIVRVTVSDVWINCPRYVHRYTKVAQSRYVPKDACETPLAEWKRIDLMQDVLPPKDHGRPEQSGGVITMGDWMEKVKVGEG
ncbi:pyridoxamine 5'-phosphate oxidase family protein [Sorangium sp. So ce385]